VAAKKKNFIKGAIKRPGALTAAKKPGETTRQAAMRLKKSGTTQQKQEANLYLNVLAPASKKRKKSKPKKK
jgi:carboxylesterase type B